MQSGEIRKKFLDFFEKRGHTVLLSASLVPENDPSVLFNTAGMQPLIPYLMGEPHPSGSKRLVNVQKCVRTQDIDEVGDNTHDTFFEMLGNWSLGDYFKEDAIKWSFEFLTDKNEGFGLDPKRLYVTVFEGDENAPKDTESFEIWKKYIPENRIYFMSAKTNWWSPGDNGPCGPDTEMFYDITKNSLGDMIKEEYIKADDEQKVVEIWNDVFMEYEKKDGKVIGKLEKQNVDTGAGLERLAMVTQGKDNIFDTDLFVDTMNKIDSLKVTSDIVSERILADHIRTAVLLISDGVKSSNKDQGYLLRRLLRRAILKADKLGLGEGVIGELVEIVIKKYSLIYKNIEENKNVILDEIKNEEIKFRKTLKKGIKEFEKLSIKDISGYDAFVLFSSYGFPLELTKELAKDKSISVDKKGFEEEMKKHQELSRLGAEQRFKGGMAGHGEMETKYHTVTHLLHKALQIVLGERVVQKGSNITAERLRFDFAHDQKMTDEEKQKVTDLVNEQIQKELIVSYKDMPLEEARKKGALGLFEDKYGNTVRMYSIGDFSVEVCGGPHVKNTKELGKFRIKKEEASSAGVRRIKAILE